MHTFSTTCIYIYYMYMYMYFMTGSSSTTSNNSRLPEHVIYIAYKLVLMFFIAKSRIQSFWG